MRFDFDFFFVRYALSRFFSGVVYNKYNEVYGDGKMLGFEFRQYDSRLGRWWGIDPLREKYPNLSPYVFCANSPIMMKEIDGTDFYPKQEGNTITIQAVFYAPKEMEADLESATRIWNSSEFQYVVTENDVQKTYTIKFELTYKCDYNTALDASTGFSNHKGIIPANFIQKYDIKARGEISGGKYINISTDNSKFVGRKVFRTIAHEMGHALGLLEWDLGLMESGGSSESILPWYIEKIMSVATGSPFINSSNINENIPIQGSEVNAGKAKKVLPSTMGKGKVVIENKKTTENEN